MSSIPMNQFITLLAIVVIAALEFLAIVKGIDGKSLAISLAAIALLAPSPLFNFRWKDISIEKQSAPSTSQVQQKKSSKRKSKKEG